MTTMLIFCARGWSPDCLGSTELEVHDDDPGGDEDVPVTAILSSAWTLVEAQDWNGEWGERPCCIECLSPSECHWLHAQRAQVDEHMRGR